MVGGLRLTFLSSSVSLEVCVCLSVRDRKKWVRFQFVGLFVDILSVCVRVCARACMRTRVCVCVCACISVGG